MRARRTAQRSLFDPTPVDHPLADELERVSALLDECPELLDGVVADLGVSEAGGRGRHGLTRESVLRCAIVLHLRQATCRGLEFLLRDSLTAQRFARVDTARLPVASLFEPHTDIIVKGGRGTCHGHKLNLATGRSGLALDAVVEDGNPADSARCLPMPERHVAHCGSAPTHAAFDGGHVSRHNVETARELGVRHAAFHKKRGVKPQDMTPSSWVYAQLKRFRAGVEAGISCLKRCFGLGRCHWRGLAHFKAYAQSAAVAHNLVRLARLRPAPG